MTAVLCTQGAFWDDIWNDIFDDILDDFDHVEMLERWLQCSAHRMHFGWYVRIILNHKFWFKIIVLKGKSHFYKQMEDFTTRGHKKLKQNCFKRNKKKKQEKGCAAWLIYLKKKVCLHFQDLILVREIVCWGLPENDKILSFWFLFQIFYLK